MPLKLEFLNQTRSDLREHMLFRKFQNVSESNTDIEQWVNALAKLRENGGRFFLRV